MHVTTIQRTENSPIEADVNFPSVILIEWDGLLERHIVHLADPTVIVGIMLVPLLLVLCR